MREINIADTTNVELWPGRRLYTDDILVNLPKGAMSAVFGNQRTSISFGNVSRSSLVVIAMPDQGRALYNAIVEAERPSEGVVTLK